MDNNSTKSHKDLYSMNGEYNPILNEKLDLLYEGGFAIQEKAELFLDRLEGLEDKKAYDRRLKCASYIPYLSEFITQFGASLFSEELEVKAPGDANDDSTSGDDMTDEFYKEFFTNCDLNGRSLHQFMQDVFETGLDELKVYVGMDFPKVEEMPNNLLEEEMYGYSKAYLYTIPYVNVIDWKTDPRSGKYIWLKAFEECFPNDNPLELATHYYRFTIWTIQNGVGHYQCWESEIMPLNKKYSGSTKYSLKEDSDTSFPEIPIHCFYVPKGYHVGQQIGSLCQEHYQRRSFQVSNANKTCVALGVVKLGPEITAPGDALPPDIEMIQEPKDLRRKLESEGWVVLRKTDKWSDEVEIVEAKGESHKFISEELKHLVESMMQTLRQMNMTAAANQKALGRSAASKMVDQHGTSMLLSVYERIVKDFVKKMMVCISAGRNEDIKWTTEGLSIAEPVQDRKDLITEIQSLGVDIMKFPQMWKNKYLFRLSTELLDNNLSDKEKLELQDKFEELIDGGAFDAEQLDAQGKPVAKNTAINAPGGSDMPDGGDDPLSMDGGHHLLPEGAHLQTGEHIDANTVYDQLAEDYKPKDIEFVKHMAWRGPLSVPLSSIDNSNMDNWASAQPEQQDHVDMFAEKMQNGDDIKPIILVNNVSNDNKMELVDGHHRYLAALKAGKPIPAYIGEVSSDDGPWHRLHSKQVGSKQSSKQSSNQMNETSMQKEVSRQVKDSESAPSGKTK